MGDELTKETAAQLKGYAIALKQAGYVYYDSGDQRLSPELRQRALQLHYYVTKFMMTSNGYNIDLVFNPENTQLMLAGGDTFEGFVAKLKNYDLPIKCNAVWDETAVAYRCYTCGLNPCMSICVKCFEAGNHEGHDYNRFFSTSGGKCDCGDEEVVLESGFCNKHGMKNNVPNEMPLDLSAMIEFIMIKLAMKLAGTFRCFVRRISIEDQSSIKACFSEIVSDKIIKEAIPILAFLDETMGLASPCIDMMAQILCSTDLYTKINQYSTTTHLVQETTIAIEEMDTVKRKEPEFLEDVASLKEYVIPESLISRVKFLPRAALKFECLLDEFMFYQSRLGYPQSLINFLLKLLPHYEFKIRFAKNFFRHYDSIERLLYELGNEPEAPVGTHVPSKIASRVVHISVQICSSQKMCDMLQEETSIVRRVLESALRFIFFRATQLDIADPEKTWYGLDMERNSLIESASYSAATTDLQNLFAHPKLLGLFFEDAALAEEYVLFVSSLEGINSLKRIAYGNHTEMDIATHAHRLYQFEMELSIAFIHQIMFVNYDGIKHRFFASFLINKLKDFFDAVLSDSVKLIFHNNRASFHIPLHRQLAVVCTKYFVANNSLDILPDDPNLLRALIAHPLRLQAIVSEYFAGMWSRNGSVLATNVLLYLHPSFKIFLDNDLALIRLVTAKLQPFEITRLMYKAYHLNDCRTYCCHSWNNELPPPTSIVTNTEWIPSMFDGYLKLLLELVFVRSLAEETIEEELRLQLIHVLAAIEKAPYSRIRQYFNYIQQIDDALFERILNEIAEFVKPEVGTSAQQGHFVLRPEYWLGRVDLIQTKHRASNQREYNTIILRQEKELAKISPNLADRTPWPYYKLPELERNDLVFTKTSHVLMQPANIHVCRFIFEWYLYNDLSIHLVQQAIYALTLTLKLASLPSSDNIELEFLNSNNPIESKESCISTFGQSRSRFFGLFNEAPTQAMYTGAREIDSLTMLLIKLFYKLHGEEFSKTSTKAQAAKMLQKMCQMNSMQLDQVIGSGVDYLGRLITWIFNSDPISQQIIKDEVFSTNQEASSPATQSLLDRKMAARKRQLELLQQQKSKQQALLKRLADQEGVSDNEMETEQTQESDIVCSICNDSCDDKNIQKPFGLLIFIQSGSVSEDCVTESTSSKFVIGETQVDAFGQALDGILMATYRDFENEAVPCFYKKHDKNTVFSLLPYFEIKSCGHHAHLSCYETYRKTVMANAFSHHRKVPPQCPMCRTNTSYILPFASKSVRKAFVDFDEIYTNEEECFAKLLEHLDYVNFEPSISPDSLNYYKKLQEKVIKMTSARENLRSSIEPTNAVGKMLEVLEENPGLLPLSLIKNYVDRITTVEENDYKFSDRLKGILTEHLYFMACVSYNSDSGHLFANVWAKMDGNGKKFAHIFESNTLTSLLHYDSQSLLVICSSALTMFNLPDTARLGLFRIFFKFLLAHCFVRTLIISLLHRPEEKYQPILNALLSTSLSSSYSQVTEYLLQTPLLSSSKPENANAAEVIASTINETVSTNIAKFLQFALNLASELRLVFNVTTMRRDDFGALFSHCLNMILGQEMQLVDVIQAVDASNSRITHWLKDFLKTSSGLQSCYADTIWDMKKLRNLPNSFDTLFRAYFDQKCSKCDTIPAQPMVCLVCGRLLCLDTCCEQQSSDSPVRISEIEAHANTCCSGSACFLHIVSTMIVFYNKRFVSIFQSPYLDRHFEEDRNLKRGKSLFLSKERFEKIQHQWVIHDFERTPNSTSPFPIDSLSEVIRHCHNL